MLEACETIPNVPRYGLNQELVYGLFYILMDETDSGVPSDTNMLCLL